MTTTSQSIISSICLSNQCCQRDQGCDYLGDISSLCAYGSDHRTPLCSRCEQRYYEAVNGNFCARYDVMHDEYVLLKSFAVVMF